MITNLLMAMMLMAVFVALCNTIASFWDDDWYE